MTATIKRSSPSKLFPRPLTQEVLKEVIHYDPITGIFTWLVRDRKYFPTDSRHKSWNTAYAGKEAGLRGFENVHSTIAIGGKNYQAHRLAFLYMTGAFPTTPVDHINHTRFDNRWENLRLVTSSENCLNKAVSSRNRTGTPGVYWSHRHGKWVAAIWINRKLHWLGEHDEFADAIAARKKAEAELGFHPNHAVHIGMASLPQEFKDSLTAAIACMELSIETLSSLTADGIASEHVSRTKGHIANLIRLRGKA